MPKLKAIKKIIKSPCYCCNPTGKSTKKSGCKICHTTRQYKDYHYYYIYIGQDGKKYCIDGDSLK